MKVNYFALIAKAHFILLSIILFFCLIPQNSKAQIKKDSAVIRLHEVVVESQQVADSRKLMPSSLSVINNATLQVSPQLEVLKEAEQSVPGLFIAGKGIMGTGAGPLMSGKISMRGLTSSSNSATQILIDGVPMMMGLFGHPLPDAIDQTNIDRIEVLRGPASLQYGGSAMAGAINFITANPAAGTHNLMASMEWGSFGTDKRSFSASVGKEKYFLQAGYSHNATDGFRENSAFTSDDYFFRYGVNFSKHFQRIFSIYLSRATNNDPGTTDTPFLTTTHVQRTLVSYKLTNNFQGLKGGLTLFYQQGINHFSDGWNSKDYMGGARLEEQFPLFTGNTLLAGAETRWYGGKGSPVGFPTSPLNDVWIRQSEQSAFAIMQQKAGELLTLNVGMRTVHHVLFGYTTSPSIGATLAIGKGSSLRGLYSQGFRNPTIGELYYFPPANVTLKPEKAENIELGMNSKLFNDHLAFDLTLFSAVASNLIFTVPAPVGSIPPVKNLNAKRVSNTGLELSTKLSLPYTQLSVNYMYLQQNDTPLPFAPKHKLTAQLQSSVRKLMMNLEYQFISGMYTDYPATTLSRFSVVDLALVYPITHHIQLKITGNNLLDEKYRIMKGYPMPGRVLMGGFTLNLF